MKLIGYKLKYQKHNGDSYEWSRIITYESEIFSTKEAAIESIELVKERMLKEEKEKNFKYLNFQYDCEVENGRDTNEFLCQTRKNLMNNYKRILRIVRDIEIVPVYVRETPSSKLNYYELG